MSQRIEVINYLTGLFETIVPETYYTINNRKKVIYPYQTFTLTGEPIRFMCQGFYIDVDLFDNSKSDVGIEKALSAMIEFFNGQEPFNQLTDSFLIQISYNSDDFVPTGSDMLKRRNLRLYAKFDWGK